MLPRDEPAAPDMTPRNRAERRVAARTAVKRIKRPRVGTLDTFRAFSLAPLDAKRPQRAPLPAPLPAGHLSRQQRRAALRTAAFARTDKSLPRAERRRIARATSGELWAEV